MGENTAISWTHHTFNPWHGCFKVSPGCKFCYAQLLARRWGYDIWGPPETTGRRLFPAGSKHWLEPLAWNEKARRAGERRRVFCASMADVFEDHPALPPERARLWSLIEVTPWLDWLLLTKRPENIRMMVPAAWLDQPRANVWFGTSVEDQARADERIPMLLQVPAVVRFLSAEPLLGQVDLSRWLTKMVPTSALTWFMGSGPTHLPAPNRRSGLHWVIAGGESGPQHRPLDLDYARLLRDQCVAAGVAFHFKQIGGRHHAAGGRLLDGREWNEFPSGAGASAGGEVGRA